MKRIMLTVAYDGTNYGGWQIQNNAQTIEGVLNRELSDLLGEEIRVIGASRTDAGVHSLGNVAVFDTETRIPARKISYALNARLPDDIAVQDSRIAAPDFHPRRCDSRKTYEYRILNRPFPLPTRRFDTYFYYRPLNVDRMRAAASYLVGMHDFKSFCSAGSQADSTVRVIYSLSVQKENDIITIRVQGNGFLYNMVRIIAGTLILAGSSAIEPEDMAQILAAKDRAAAGPTAPAHGLTMAGIEFF